MRQSRINRVLFPFRAQVSRLPADYYGVAQYPDPTRSTIPRYLNIGALDFPHPLWHGLDHPTSCAAFARYQAHVDLAHDLMSDAPLPVASGSLRIAYCSHVLEHLRDADVARLCGELVRVLEPGGIVRIVVPDATVFHAAYLRGDRSAFAHALRIYPSPTIEDAFLQQIASALLPCHPDPEPRPRYAPAEVRAYARTHPCAETCAFFTAHVPVCVQQRHPADHLNWWTVEKLLPYLQEAGLTAWRSAFGQSSSPLLRDTRFFDPYPDHSCYVEAIR